MKYIYLILSLFSFLACTNTSPITIELNRENIELKENVKVLKGQIDSLKNDLYLCMQQPARKNSIKKGIVPVVVKERRINNNRRSYSSGSANSRQCNAMTKRGSQCLRSSRSGGYCWQHGG